MKIFLFISILCLINASTAQWLWNSDREPTPSDNVNVFIENNSEDEKVTNAFVKHDEPNVYIDEHGHNHNEDMMTSTTKEPAIVYPYDPNEDRNNRMQPQPQHHLPEPDYRAVDMRGLIKLI